MEFYFKKSYMGQAEPDSLIFMKQDRIFSLNYETDELTTILKFNNPLGIQPDFFCVTKD